jgi:capsular exopolysaccharide synthesis family protein
MQQNSFDYGLDEPQEASGAGTSRSLWQVVWQRKSLVLLGVVVGLVVGGLAYLQRPSVYQSSAQVLVLKKQSDMPISATDARGFAPLDDYVSTHLVLIRSPLIISRAVEKHHLSALPSFAGADPVGRIAASLTATREKDSTSTQTNIINLSYRGPVAADCEVVLNAVIDTYQAFLEEKYQNVSGQTVKLITTAKDLLDTNLREEERKYREFREKSPVIWKGKDGNSSSPGETRFAEMESKRAGLLVRKAELEERLKAVERARKEGKGPELLLSLANGTPDKPADNTELEKLKAEQLLPLLAQERVLLEEFGENHPDVRAVRHKIAMTREYFNRRTAGGDGPAGAARGQDRQAALEAAVEGMKQEVAALEVSLQSLGRLIEAEEKEARELARYEVKDEGFRTDIARTQRLYDQTIDRLREINIVRDFGGYDAQVLAPAGRGGKVAPMLWQFAITGVALGLLAGAGLAYAADASDKSFRTLDEIRRRLGLPLVGHIPFFSHDDLAAEEGAEAGVSPMLCTYHQSSSLEAEAYRRVRTSLYFSTQGERHKVIQITSPNMGDGKSTLAANLAISIAQSGKKVILVDADCRRPSVHRLFGLPAGTGLGPVLLGEAELAAAVHESGVPRLDVLPCGPRPENPSELLTSPRFEELLADLRARYDFVVVDTPPLLAVSDPCVVAPRVDGVLLTIRVSKNGRPAAERAKETLATLGANVFGVVVNAVDEQAQRYGYGYEYQYQYEYRPDDTHEEADDAAGTNGTNGAAPVGVGAALPAPRATNGTGAGLPAAKGRRAGGRRPQPPRKPARGPWYRLRRWLGIW